MKKLIILAVALVALLGVSDAQQQLCAAHDFTCFCNRYVNVYAGEDPTVGGLPLTIGQLIENRGIGFLYIRLCSFVANAIWCSRKKRVHCNSGT